MALELPVGLGGPVLPGAKLCDSPGTSLSVQWLNLWVSTAWGRRSIPGWGTKIAHALRQSPE